MQHLFNGIANLHWDNLVMLALGGVLIYLAIRKIYEPALLLPIGFGAILCNIPFSSALGEHGPLTLFYKYGIETELFPLLIFIAIGAMIDFGPLLSNPVLLLFGAAAQFGIFVTMALAALCGFTLKESASIGIIGAADGPTAIYVASYFRIDSAYAGAIAVAAYSYMALVPLIQPLVIRLLTTRRERRIVMPDQKRAIPKATRVLFPIAVTLLAGLLVPMSVALIGFLMFGNLLRESGVVERLSQSAQNELANLVTLLLGLSIGSTMIADKFLTPKTLIILGIGVLAFVLDTASGVLFAKLLNLFRKQKLNPMIGACGISAFPMSARVVHRMAQEENPQNVLLMHAVGANVGGQIGSVMAGGIIIALVNALSH